MVGSDSVGTRNLPPQTEGAISEHSVVGRAQEVPPNPEEVLDDSVNGEEALGLAWRLEPAHLSLSLSRRLMRDLRSVVGVPARVVDHRRHGAPPRCAVAPQLVGHEAQRP